MGDIKQEHMSYLLILQPRKDRKMFPECELGVFTSYFPLSSFSIYSGLLYIYIYIYVLVYIYIYIIMCVYIYIYWPTTIRIFSPRRTRILTNKEWIFQQQAISDINKEQRVRRLTNLENSLPSGYVKIAIENGH